MEERNVRFEPHTLSTTKKMSLSLDHHLDPFIHHYKPTCNVDQHRILYTSQGKDILSHCGIIQ